MVKHWPDYSLNLDFTKKAIMQSTYVGNTAKVLKA